MLYYVKIFNLKTDKLVGYYKETGKNNITSMMNGMKLFDNLEDALIIANEIDGGFLRDKDHHYYTAYCSVFGDKSKQPPKEVKKSKQEKEEELQDALETFIRKNSSEVTE